MSVTKTIKRPPIAPGEILDKEFLEPLGMTQAALATALDCEVKTVNRIVNGRQAVTAEMALKLGAYFRTTPEFWLNMQRAVDLYEARQKIARFPSPVRLAKNQERRVSR